MSLIKGIKKGYSDITSTYDSATTVSDINRLTVVEAELGGITLSSYETTYTGSAQTPIPTVTATVGGNVVTLTKDEDYTLSYSNNTDAGTATVKATGIGNFTGEVSTTWEIQNANITVDAQDQSYAYNGILYGNSISVSYVGDNSANVVIEYGIGSNTYTTTTTPRISNVSESTTIYYRVTIPNHNTNEGSYTLQIRPRTVILQWGETSWIYDGNEHSTTCVVTNLVSGDECTVALTGNSITNIAQSPVTVTATGLSNSNYTLTSASNTSVQLTINHGLFVKISGEWTPVKEVYRKESGDWVKRTYEYWNGNVFSTSEAYVKKD